ncbi:MAG: hypothetical protein V8R81_04880 [Clostridia bacterium]
MKKEMEQKILFIILLIALLLGLSGCSTAENMELKENSSVLEIRTQYTYNEKNNTVTGKIKSNNPLKNTKVSWKLSQDGKTYTNENLKQNGKYETIIEDIYGNIKSVEINVDLIDDKGPEIKMEYKYNEENNTVTAIIHSNEELKDTKTTWKLSEDKLTYTNENMTSNGSYYKGVKDKWGNKSKAFVDIKLIDNKGPEIEMEYKYNEENNTVIAIMHSNEELKDTKTTWKLSEDKLTYTNENMTSNGSYYTGVKDKWGNESKVLIDIKIIDNKPPEISMEYVYNSNDTVKVIMHSNEEMADTKKSWELSENKLEYSKIFDANQKYFAPVQDKWGNSTNVEINFKKKLDRNQPNGLSIGYMFIKDCKVLVQILSQEKMLNTKPTWEYKDDGYRYTKSFYDNINYETTVDFENGTHSKVHINIDYFFKINDETGIYGYSGAIVQNKPGGTDLTYYKWGNGNNVMFATFCVHGFEDSWARDGAYLVEIADKFHQTLAQNADEELARKWTIYIFREVNPDGRRIGYSNAGPGRRTVYSKIGKGIDINRAWQTENKYKIYTDSRNYNGTAPDQAYEAEYLKNFLINHKTSKGQNILVDLHGWENQLIGNEQICNYYKEQFPSCSTRAYGRYGTQYLIGWARQNLGARTALVELPKMRNSQEAENNRLSDKYINATIKMLKNI